MPVYKLSVAISNRFRLLSLCRLARVWHRVQIGQGVPGGDQVLPECSEARQGNACSSFLMLFLLLALQENWAIMRDLATLQVHLRDIEGFNVRVPLLFLLLCLSPCVHVTLCGDHSPDSNSRTMTLDSTVALSFLSS